MTAAEFQPFIALRFRQAERDDSLFAYLANETLNAMWYAYPWRQSVSTLPPFFLVYGMSDYGPPLYYLPEDFYGLERAWLSNLSGSPVRELTILRTTIPVRSGIVLPDTISYQPEFRGFRLNGASPAGSPQYMVNGVYKTVPPVITNANLTSQKIPFEDIYAPVFRQGLTWKYTKELEGAGQREHLEQAMFRSMLQEMALSEGLMRGGNQIYPSEPLAMR